MIFIRWASIVWSGITPNAKCAIGRKFAVYGTLLGWVLFPALDEAQQVGVIRLCMFIWLTIIVSLRRTSICFIWFFNRNRCVWKSRSFENVCIAPFLSTSTKINNTFLKQYYYWRKTIILIKRWIIIHNVYNY